MYADLFGRMFTKSAKLAISEGWGWEMGDFTFSSDFSVLSVLKKEYKACLQLRKSNEVHLHFGKK